jgi:hypothetical protein
LLLSPPDPDPPPDPDEERSSPDPEDVAWLCAVSVTTAGLPDDVVPPPFLSEPELQPDDPLLLRMLMPRFDSFRFSDVRLWPPPYLFGSLLFMMRCVSFWFMVMFHVPNHAKACKSMGCDQKSEADAGAAAGGGFHFT